VFVEQAPASVSVLKRNLAELGLADRSRVVRGDALRAIRTLARGRERFDLVLADPPYAFAALEPLLREIADTGILLPGGMLVVERGRRHPVPLVSGLRLIEDREYGDTVITRFAASPDAGGPDDR
jgi:16S rRNA G966 N2-methylase RsmD